MNLAPRTLALLLVPLAAIAWATSGLWTPGSARDPQPEIPKLDQRARALPPETSCLAPPRLAASGPSPRCVVSFGRSVAALGVASEGSPAVVSLAHAATGTWSLPEARYTIGFEPLPAETDARVILASAARDAALFALGADLMRYEISTGRVVVRAPGPGGMIDDLGWTADGSRIAVAAGGKAYLLNEEGQVVRRLPIDGSAVHVAIDARGTHLAVASDVGGIALIDGLGDAPARTVTPSLQPAAGVAFAPSGDLWIAGSDGTLRALDPASGTERARIDVGTPLTRLALSSDGKRAATAARDRVIRLHALPAGEVVGELAWHEAQITTLGFGAGPSLVSGDGDGALAVWDVGSAR